MTTLGSYYSFEKMRYRTVHLLRYRYVRSDVYTR